MTGYHTRPARPEDQAALASFAPDLAALWPAWLSDPAGVSLVVTLDDVPVGACRVALLGDEAWLDAIALASDRGDPPTAARVLLQAAGQAARQGGTGVLRASADPADDALAEAYAGVGFAPIGELRYYLAATAGAPPEDAAIASQRPGPEERDRLWDWLERSNLAPLVGGLAIFGGRGRALTDVLLAERLAAAAVWTITAWDEIQALAITDEDHEDGTLAIAYIDGASQAIGELALALRIWAQAQGFAQVTAATADLLILTDALNGAGYGLLTPRPLRLLAMNDV